MTMDPAEEARLAKVEQAMFGPVGEGGMYGELKSLQSSLTGIYKMLAVTSLSIFTTGFGVIVTLIVTKGGP